MKDQVKTKIITLATFVVVIVITIALVQLVGIGIDMLRKKADIGPAQPIQPIQPTQISTTTSENKSCKPESFSFDKCDGYKKTPIYPNGMETSPDYIKNAQEELINAGRAITITGEVEDAYIYIKAGATDENGNFSSIKKSFDGIWFYLQDGHFNGGVLDLSKSIYGKPSEITELLYNIKSVSIAKNNEAYRENQYETENLLSELSGERKIGALVSSSRYGKIIDLSIYYKCKGECDIHLKQ